LYQPAYDQYHLKLVQKIREHFPHVAIAYEFVPSFSELWSITLGARNPLDITNGEVDKILVEMGIENLRYYDGTSHGRAFCPPRYLSQSLR
jgi:spermidine synthase